jgi:hypothetical protein
MALTPADLKRYQEMWRAEQQRKQGAAAAKTVADQKRQQAIQQAQQAAMYAAMTAHVGTTGANKWAAGQQPFGPPGMMLVKGGGRPADLFSEQ